MTCFHLYVFWRAFLHLSLACVADRLNELVLGTHLAHRTRRGAVGRGLGHDGPDFGRRLAAEQVHLALQQNGHGGADEQRVALKDVHVPEARSLVNGQQAGKDARENVSQVQLRGQVRDAASQVVVQRGRLVAEGAEDEVESRCLGGCVGCLKGQRQRSVEDVGEGDKGRLGVGQVEQQKCGNGL